MVHRQEYHQRWYLSSPLLPFAFDGSLDSPVSRSGRRSVSVNSDPRRGIRESAARRLSIRSTARLSGDVLDLDRLSTSTNESSSAVAATTGVGAAGLRCREGDRRLPASRALHQGGGQIGDRTLKRLAVSSILIVYLHRWWPRQPTPRRGVAGKRAPSSV